ncbi:MAG: flagellar biosynthesis protein FlgA [Pseudomonadota bacterium]|nr:flagellar biosynthesis protein FlgA [Pseudomonadota bacterium]
MNLHQLAQQRAERCGPIGVALIGAGKFGSMFLAQTPMMPGLAVRAIADLYPDRIPARLRGLGWDERRIRAVALTDSAAEAIGRDDVDVVIEATGDPIAGIAHALQMIAARKHLVMVNVEADALAGPALARRAREAGAVYSLAYGDQPALIAEQVDWARACGFRVAAAGKGTKYLPAYHASTPDTVWSHYGLSSEEARAAGMNSQMFNSFLDGTKSAIEMAAVANACRLDVPEDGLEFPPCGADELARVLGPRLISRATGGAGLVEVVSSLKRDGSPVERDLRWGVYVVLEAPNDYAASCFKQYGLPTDASGRYAAMYKPYHLIGLELGVSVYSAVLRGEPTGAPVAFRGDAVAVAKRDLVAGERLDGEGGFTVWGKLIPARRSIETSALPIGLAKDIRLTRSVTAGEIVRMLDVSPIEAGPAIELRRESCAMAAAE